MTVSLFHLGPPKTATTWLYKCLREHPQIVTTPLDRVHYFDLHHVRGDDWYHAQFQPGQGASEEATWFDPTYSYICSPRAAERIAAYNPDARLMVCLRDPVDRAFSHYWHLKKNTQCPKEVDFGDALTHYNTFATWVEHGFVGIGLRWFLEHFPREQLHVMLFEDLNRDPDGEFAKICRFAGIDETFVPPSLHRKVNVAGARATFLGRLSNRASRRLFGKERLDRTRDSSALVRWLSGKSEYLRGIDPAIEAELRAICEPEIVEMERLTGLDLSHWRVPTNPD